VDQMSKISGVTDIAILLGGTVDSNFEGFTSKIKVKCKFKSCLINYKSQKEIIKTKISVHVMCPVGRF
jgi:hypothetical protein